MKKYTVLLALVGMAVLAVFMPVNPQYYNPCVERTKPDPAIGDYTRAEMTRDCINSILIPKVVAAVIGLVAGAVLGSYMDSKARPQSTSQQRQRSQTSPADSSKAKAATSGGDSAAELERLAALHRSGALTDEEFQAAKAKLLGL